MQPNCEHEPSQLPPPGRYVCALKQRHCRDDCCSVVFEVESGALQGKQFAVAFHDDFRAAKAARLDGPMPVVVQVIRKQSRTGRSYDVVGDFWQLHSRTEVTVLGGMPAGDLGPEDIAPLPYEYESDMKRLKEDLFYCPEGLTPYSSPLLSEYLANHLSFVLSQQSSGDQAKTAPTADQRDSWFARTFRRVATDHRYGLLSESGKPPQLVAYEEAFAAYCRAEAPPTLAQASRITVCQFGRSLPEHMRSSGGGCEGYRGPAWARWLPVRFNFKQDDPSWSLERCRMFVTALVRLDVLREHIMVFTGGEGEFEVLFPAAYFGGLPRPGFEFVAANLGLFISDWSAFCDPANHFLRKHGYRSLQGQMAIAIAPYRLLSTLQLPNTRAQGAGGYKVRITLEELASLEHGEFTAIARRPRPFSPPSWEVAPCNDLTAIWSFCVAVAVCRSQTVNQVVDGDRWIHAATFDFLRRGADPEELDRRVFAAAMNLLDFRCPQPLLEALLSPVAFSCGMTVARLKRTIKNAIENSRRARVLPIDEFPGLRYGDNDPWGQNDADK